MYNSLSYLFSFFLTVDDTLLKLEIIALPEDQWQWERDKENHETRQTVSFKLTVSE